jgi:hypothetical protein
MKLAASRHEPYGGLLTVNDIVDVPVAMPPNPAIANVEGYLQLGQSLLRKRAGNDKHA